MNRLLLPALLALALPAAAQDGTWQTFNGDLAAQKFSPLTEITPENVADLAVAWQMHTGDVSDGVHRPSRMHGPAGSTPPPTVWSATPLFVNDTLYVGTPVLPHLRARARHRRGQVDLRQPGRARGADPARPEEPRRRLLGRRRSRRRRSPARSASTSAPWTPSSTPSTPTPASPAPTSARAASSTSTASTPPTPAGRSRCCSRPRSSATPSSSAGPARTGPRRSIRPARSMRSTPAPAR